MLSCHSFSKYADDNIMRLARTWYREMRIVFYHTQKDAIFKASLTLT